MSDVDINYVQFDYFNKEINSMNDTWKQLDEVCRKWAIMSQYEKDLKEYAERAARVE